MAEQSPENDTYGKYLNLKDEQERVQKKTFTNWMNSVLAKHTPPQHVDDIFVDIRDGTKLLALLESLSGESLKYEKGKNLRRLHFLSNIRTALAFLEGKKIKMVNINASDIVDGKPSIVLGLVWTIILYYQIEEQTNILAKQILTGQPTETDGQPPTKKKAGLQAAKTGAKKALLKWAQRAAAKRVDRAVGGDDDNMDTRTTSTDIKDFGKSWRDGMAFNVMIHSIRPELIDLASLQPKTNEQRLDNAFTVAERDLGIPQLLDPKDVDVDKPDEKSIMTYVSQFLKEYPEVGDDESSSLMGSVRDMHAVAKEEESLYQEILDHVLRAEAVLVMAKEGKMNKLEEYEQYEELSEVHEHKKKAYVVFVTKYENKVLVSITEEKVVTICERWERVTRQVIAWKQAIDATMPKPLMYLIKWIERAEVLVKVEPTIQKDNYEESAKEIKSKLSEHMGFFKDSDRAKSVLEEICESGQCEGTKLPSSQLNKMATRLDNVLPTAKRRQLKLQYEELKYGMLGFVVMAERRLKSWTVKYGNQENVEALLDNYMDFIEKDKFFQRYESGFQQLQAVAEAYYNGIQDAEEKSKVRKFVNEQGTKMKNLSVEIHSVESMLDKVLQNWTNYNRSVEELQAWLEHAERVLTQPHEARKEFFRDLQTWMDKHTLLNDSGNFLIEVCKEDVSFDIKQQLLLLNRRWKDIFEQGKIYMKEEEAERLQRQT
uniref:Nesprin-1-like n=1 Tax=Saccoglossus kowalevskii TaxID=10224 RepID=A0ABM0MXV7_SACKO|nr:PREDICTED: nesprin-1-like [Saccoglossus kowalevskii]